MQGRARDDRSGVRRDRSASVGLRLRAGDQASPRAPQHTKPGRPAGSGCHERRDRHGRRPRSAWPDSCLTLPRAGLNYSVSVYGVLDPDVLFTHIHRSSEGAAGPVAHLLGGRGESRVSGGLTLSAAELAGLHDGELYVDVHTTEPSERDPRRPHVARGGVRRSRSGRVTGPCVGTRPRRRKCATSTANIVAVHDECVRCRQDDEVCCAVEPGPGRRRPCHHLAPE